MGNHALSPRKATARLPKIAPTRSPLRSTSCARPERASHSITPSP
jgi:hypothetical protein